MTYKKTIADYELTAFLEGCRRAQVEHERFGKPDRNERPSSAASKRFRSEHLAQVKKFYAGLDAAHGPDRLAAAVAEGGQYDQTEKEIAAYSRRKAGQS
ncbi:hypothetical protein M2390_002587 [Mycetocola sp. BIGb0189]|uniref:hypothetical protein n=1 Tax=Mycetocola sp. BIGb0189 TaxID=2940604 RepID=UPI00216845D3|nr:hypothetical protein [Mycetocola sp. BIGb0189]MCS4277381.1 hypothetical protein [Mycetocola sp. BIGb0189]